MNHSTPDRRAMIAKAHIAKKDMRLDDDSYRAVIQRVAGAASCSACTNEQLAAVLAEFRRLGWQGPAAAGPRTSRKPWVRMIYGIWADLRPLLDNATEETLRAFVRRQTRDLRNPEGVGDPEWLDAPQGTKVIQGLHGWLARTREKKTESADV